MKSHHLALPELRDLGAHGNRVSITARRRSDRAGGNAAERMWPDPVTSWGCGVQRGDANRIGAELGRGNKCGRSVGGDGVPHGEPNVAKLAVRPCHAPLPVRLLKVYVGIDRRQPTLPMLSRRAKCWLSFTSSASASLPPFCLWLLTTSNQIAATPPCSSSSSSL